MQSTLTLSMTQYNVKERDRERESEREEGWDYFLSLASHLPKASGTSHPEHWNSKLIELRRRTAPVKGVLVMRLQMRDDIVIGEEVSEPCLGSQSTSWSRKGD